MVQSKQEITSPHKHTCRLRVINYKKQPPEDVAAVEP